MVPDGRVVGVDVLLADLERGVLAPRDQTRGREDVEVTAADLGGRVVGGHRVVELAHGHWTSLAENWTYADSSRQVVDVRSVSARRT
jgi:hypothetical protein